MSYLLVRPGVTAGWNTVVELASFCKSLHNECLAEIVQSLVIHEGIEKKWE